MYKLLFSLGCLFLSAALTAGSFPLCMYGVNDTKYLKMLKKAGFNCVQTYSKDAAYLRDLAKKAKKLKMTIVPMPEGPIRARIVQEATSWPIKAWYIYDEPDIARLAPQKLRNIESNTNAALPGAPTAFVLSKGVNAKSYYDVADILMVDWYPVPHLQLDSFGQQIRDIKDILKEKNLDDKPVWGVVQSFDWREYKQYRPDNDRIGRFPAQKEMLFMALHGLMEGMSGVFFFTFNSLKVPLPQASPENWDRVVETATILKKFMPIFEEGKILTPPEGKFNNILMQKRLYKGKYYYFVLNNSSKDELMPEIFKAKEYKVIYGEKADFMPPYETLILKSKI